MSHLLSTVQARFLRELFRAGRAGFVLKGDMALRTLFGASRLTRDIDLDFPPPGVRSADSLHKQMGRALKEALRGSGVVDVRISEPGKAEVSPRWKVSGRGATGEPFTMKVEVSRRAPPPGAVRQATVAGVAALGLGTFYVDLYDERTLVALKLAALIGRAASRDVYDLDLLLPAAVPETEMIEWLLGQCGLSAEQALSVCRQNLAAMGFEVFRTQMLADPTLLDRIGPDGWRAMKDRVANSLPGILGCDRRAAPPAR